ncbi:translation initiation factor IF-2 subunit alpha [Methanocaldococcus villosus KIN24-T80]|uniref:Translation initiation factor 2 subunit alpha n=1 Tax=Methanocaldococcus villosus KIN24-T80 TaxID=1069083 RepID=N6VTZ7_9EURY|nr:translation initiation factor IF-2 subunit alpha [Methanocaldococcus villosus]ENN96651.1 translation initiation factor IF-2 subunit alpha [Methanocaldococcus villosus KIN24-T80]
MRKEFPEEGDIVIGVVKEVKPYGAFVELLEYPGKEGMIHISEVTSGWVKNIRDHVKPGQRVVAKVLRVDEKKGHIDLSLKRISEQQRREKIQEWKRFQRASKMLERAAEKLGKSLEEAWDEVGYLLEDEFGELYNAFETLVIEGKEALEGLDISEDWKNVLYEVAKESIELTNVEVEGIIEMTCFEPDGIDRIKKALKEALKANPYEDVEVKITYVGAPKYRVEVIAPDYKSGEEVFKNVCESAIKAIKKLKGEGKYYRVKS